jgi:DNA-binding CsgD family transcriptional regulator
VPHGAAYADSLLDSEKSVRTVCELSPREREAAMLVVGGATNKEIARELVVSEGTVKNYVHNVMLKLGARNRAMVAALMVSKAATDDRPVTAEPTGADARARRTAPALAGQRVSRRARLQKYLVFLRQARTALESHLLRLESPCPRGPIFWGKRDGGPERREPSRRRVRLIIVVSIRRLAMSQSTDQKVNEVTARYQAEAKAAEERARQAREARTEPARLRPLAAGAPGTRIQKSSRARTPGGAAAATVGNPNRSSERLVRTVVCESG